MMNNNAVHSCIPLKKCLSDIKNPPPLLYPPGMINQFISPVMVNIEKRTKDRTLTNQSVAALLLDIKVSFHDHKIAAACESNSSNYLNTGIKNIIFLIFYFLS
jgi:hypothetical protein